MAGAQVHRYRDDCRDRRPRAYDRHIEKYNNTDDARRLCNTINHRKRYACYYSVLDNITGMLSYT